jgi:hypothetical protein
VRQERRDTRVESDHAPPVTLAMLDGDGAAVEVDILGLQCEHLADAQSAPPGEGAQIVA